MDISDDVVDGELSFANTGYLCRSGRIDNPDWQFHGTDHHNCINRYADLSDYYPLFHCSSDDSDTDIFL